MDFDDIEWEETTTPNQTTTTTTTSSTPISSIDFHKNILDEFEDDKDEDEGNNDDTDEDNDNKQDKHNDKEQEEEEEEEEAIEFEIDTNEFKAKPTGKVKRVVKKVDLKEKHNCLFLHKAILACYLSNSIYTINTLSNEYLNSIVLSNIPQDIVKLYSIKSDNNDINCNNDSNDKNSKSKNKKTKKQTTTNTTTSKTIPFEECLNEIIKWFINYYKIDEIAGNDDKGNNTGNKKEIIDLDNDDNDQSKNERLFSPKKNSLLYFQIIKQIKEKRLTKKIYIEVFFMVCCLLGYQCRIVRPLNTTPPVPVTPSKLKRINSSSSPIKTSPMSKLRSKSIPSIRITNSDDDSDEDSDEKDSDSDASSKNKRKKPIVKKSKQTVAKTNSTKRSRSLSVKDKVNELKEKGSKSSPSKLKPIFNFDTSSDNEEQDDDNDSDSEGKEIIFTKPITKRQQALQANQFKNTVLNKKIPTTKSITTMEKKRKENPSFKSSKKLIESDDDDKDEKDEKDNNTDKEEEKELDNKKEIKKKKLKRSSSEPIVVIKTNASIFNENNSNDDKVEIESWIEIFNFKLNKWISIDLINKFIDKPLEFEKPFEPYSYVIAISKYQLKDVTSRYTDNYIGSSLKRLPVAQLKWWNELVTNNEVKMVGGENQSKLTLDEKKLIEKLELNEKQEMVTKESKLPFPKTFAQFKSHPIYCLEKDIPKYCSANPAIKPLGLFNGTHKIYHKDHIKVLHTVDKWVQNGRMVIDGQQPIKVVKGRSKSNPTSMLFGEWQTKIYEPPIIGEDGYVQTNSFGNVYMFNPSMTPINGVHLKGKGLIRIAKKLGISVAPALVGWEVGGRSSYPLIDGIIVAKQFSKTLYEAWMAESSSRVEIEYQKKQEEIKSRWKRFMKGLLIKDYIEKTYNNNNSSSSSNTTTTSSI